jgi:hypothetical protein
MAEPTQILFTYKEVVTALLKQQAINEGIWSLAVSYGIAAINAGPNQEQLSPAAIVPLVGIGIQKATEITNLSVDASIANPKPLTE